MTRSQFVQNSLLVLSAIMMFSCRSDEGSQPSVDGRISTDQQLFTLITQTQPYSSYSLFPNVDSVTQGTLNGSQAHQPMVRVSMNDTAVSALQNDTLPAGNSFPDGSIIFKQIRMSGQTTLFAVIYKDRGNSLSANGWLWAEYAPNGNVAFSIERRGNSCIACHSIEQGPQNDFIRTFERQH